MSTQQFKIHRVTALPSPMEAYAVYLVAPPTQPDYVEMYVTDSTGARAKRIINEADIRTMIDTSIREQVRPITEVKVVEDNAGLTAVAEETTLFVYVKDASAVPGARVSRGGAMFVRDPSNTTTGGWTKISEVESMDLVLNWNSISGKPTSSVQNIDQAVQQRHTHSNKTQLDKIGEEGGNLTYGGRPVTTAWASTAW